MARPKVNHGAKSRLTLEFPTTIRALMDKIKKVTNASSITEVIRRALVVYDILLHNQNSGAEIIIRKDGKDTTFILTEGKV